MNIITFLNQKNEQNKIIQKLFRLTDEDIEYIFGNLKLDDRDRSIIDDNSCKLILPKLLIKLYNEEFDKLPVEQQQLLITQCKSSQIINSASANM